MPKQKQPNYIITATKTGERTRTINVISLKTLKILIGRLSQDRYSMEIQNLRTNRLTVIS